MAGLDGRFGLCKVGLVGEGAGVTGVVRVRPGAIEGGAVACASEVAHTP